MTAAEPNTVSSARKCKKVKGVSELVWQKASALSNVPTRKHLSLMATAHMPGAMGRTSHPAMPEKALVWMLPKLSLSPPSQQCQEPKEHPFNLSNVPVSLTNPPANIMAE